MPADLQKLKYEDFHMITFYFGEECHWVNFVSRNILILCLKHL